MESLLLTADDDDLSPLFRSCLVEIFARFDKDKDGAWSEKELDDFAIFMKAEPFSAAEKQDIIDNFDINEKNELIVEGFFQLYFMQTQSDKQETVNDMTRLGYDDTLKFIGVAAASNAKDAKDKEKGIGVGKKRKDRD